MPRRPSASRRWLTAATWPVGIALTSWDYLWRSTPMHRHELDANDPAGHLPPAVDDGIDRAEIFEPERGRGPLFHRRYRTLIRDSGLSSRDLLQMIASDPNRAAPTTFARF